jgi:hypothetical protein
MKRSVLVCILACLLAAGSGLAQSKYVLIIRSGSMINSACVGRDMGKVVPMIGADVIYLSVSGSSRHEYTESYYYDSYEVVTREVDQDEVSGHVFMLIPQIGAKFYLDQTGVRPYLLGSFFFAMPYLHGESTSREEDWRYENGDLVDHDVYTDTDNISEKDKNLLKDALGIWGITLGGGVEYLLNERFGIGGEYGIRLMFDGAEQADRNSYEGDFQTHLDKASAKLGLTYASIVLNYHF